MKKLFILPLLLVLFACKPTNAQIVTYLQYAEDGIVVAHDSTWLNDAEYNLVTDAVNLTITKLQSGNFSASDVKKTLVDFEKSLPTNSKIPAYLDWLVVLL